MNIIAKEKFKIPGEFERQESVLIIWPVEAFATEKLNTDKVSCQVVEALAGEVNIIVCCCNEQVEERAKSVLLDCLDIISVRFVRYPVDIIYPRDFGAEVMVGDAGNRIRVHFRFDMYGYGREEDETSRIMRDFGRFHGDLAGVGHMVTSSLISEGGDREFDGAGSMMAVQETECTKRNPDKTLEEIEIEFKRLFNLDQIIWLPRCSYDDEISRAGAIPSADGTWRSFRSASANGHIDEICRFADSETIIIAYVTDDEAAENELSALNKERLDLAYEVVKAARNREGKPYRILKMPMPEPIYIDLTPQDDAFVLWNGSDMSECGLLEDGTPYPLPPVNVLPALSYCNFLIANGVVVAQKYYEKGMPLKIKEKDDQAFSVLQEAFPGRRVIQVNTLALNLYGGGIHCHTRNIPAVAKHQ